MQFQWDRSVELYTEENIVPKPWLTKCLREQALWQKSNKQKHLEKAATMCKNLTSAIVQDATQQHNRQCNYPKVNFNTEPGKSADHRPSSGSVYLMTAGFHFETEMGKLKGKKKKKKHPFPVESKIINRCKFHVWCQTDLVISLLSLLIYFAFWMIWTAKE